MISIIVPVYNVEKYLEQCVLSLLELKADYEIILVNDGSTDNSGKLCDELAEENSNIIVIHQVNGGLSAARNAGIKKASGTHVMFVDSDDFLDPIETDKMLSSLTKDMDLMMGLYRNYYMNQDTYQNENCDGFLTLSGLIPINRFLNAVPKDGQTCFMIACRFVVRTDFLKENNLFFKSGIYHEDEEWTIRMLALVDNIFVSHNYFYQYRQAREGSIMGNVKPKHIKDRLIIMYSAQSFLEEHDLESEKINYIRCRMAQLYLSIMIDSNVLDNAEKKELWKELNSFRKDCVGYMSGVLGKGVQFAITIFGVEQACAMLNIARKIKKCINRRS